jgi:hypothetical protein
MTDLEELERRKRELELRRDIAKLERNERLANKATKIADTTSGVAADISAKAAQKIGSWGWFSVSVCTLIGAFLVLGGLHDGVLIIAAVGAIFLLPLYFKLMRRSS